LLRGEYRKGRRTDFSLEEQEGEKDRFLFGITGRGERRFNSLE